MAECKRCLEYGITCREDLIDKLLGQRHAMYNGESFPIDTPIKKCPAITGELSTTETAIIIKGNINSYILRRALGKQ